MTQEKFEQGFNDSELEEIMEEIESLEDEPTNAAGQASETASNEAPVEDADSSNVISLGNEPSGTTDHSGASNASLDFAVSGDLNLSMNFHVGGQKINLTVNENQGFVISLPGGAKFNVPLAGVKTKAGDKVG